MQLCGSLSILWHCISLALECKLTFSSSVATAAFSKFEGKGERKREKKERNDKGRKEKENEVKEKSKVYIFLWALEVKDCTSKGFHVVFHIVFKSVDVYGLRRSVQFSSVAQSCPTLCYPMNRSTPGLPVHHQLLEFTQTHVHRVSDAIQPSHLLSSPSPPVPNPSQHQSLFQWVNSSHEVAKVLEFQL